MSLHRYFSHAEKGQLERDRRVRYYRFHTGKEIKPGCVMPIKMERFSLMSGSRQYATDEDLKVQNAKMELKGG